LDYNSSSRNEYILRAGPVVFADELDEGYERPLKDDIKIFWPGHLVKWLYISILESFVVYRYYFRLHD
jgi:hypothetical protein